MFCMGNFQKQQLNQDSIAKKIQNYIFKYDDVLGTGNFGAAYRGYDINSGVQVAIKVIKMSSLKSKVSEKLLQNQICILKTMKHHQNILKCYDVFTSINNCYIVTELCHHDLQKELKEKGFFQEKQVSRLIYDIYKGIQQLEKNSIIHRDLKTSNIFINRSGRAKIADFGFAIKADNVFKDLNIGSPLYMSPQGLIRNQYGPKTDVWSFGILIYQLLHGQTPLQRCSTDQQLKLNIFQKIYFRRNISSQLKQLILQCLNTDQKTRISISQISETPYMKKIFSEYQGIIHNNHHNTKQQYEKSTECSTEFVISNKMRILKHQIHYHHALALLHFCRLIHKTCQQYPSSILSQFLLNISFQLTKTNISSENVFTEQYNKLKQVLNQYYNKFQLQNDDLKLYMNFNDAKAELERMIRKLGLQKYLQVLKRQIQLLFQCVSKNDLDHYSKVSQAKIFLDSIVKTHH